MIKVYCKRYARPAEANWRLGGFGRPVWWLVGRLWGGFVASWGALRELWGGSGAALGRLWGAYGRLVGPKWPPGWPQEAAKWGQEAPRGRHKAAKSWFLEPQNGPKRVQRAIKRGIMQMMLKTSKWTTFSMKMLEFEVWKGLKISQNWSQNEVRSIISNMLSSKATPESNIEPQEAGK